MNMDDAVRTFAAESRELLEEMEAALLTLEQSPEDSDLINAIFRAAHTIKGSSGVFGFEAVEAFTHVAENLLDRLRAGRLGVSAELIALLLACRDHIALLVEAAVVDEPLDGAGQAHGETLLTQLRGLLDGGSAPTSAAPAAAASETASETADSWSLKMNFQPELLQHGFDPLSLLRYLSGMGELVSVQRTGVLPPLAELDPELCYWGIDLTLAAEGLTRQALESAVEFFQEGGEIAIQPQPRAVELAPVASEPAVAPVATRAEAAPEGGSQRPPGWRTSGGKSIRVDAQKLDQLINLVGELVISGATTNLQAQRLGDERLLESMSGMSRLVEEIRDSALRLRMVQIGETFNRFQRVVRDTAAELGKAITLSVTGAETELDKTVVEKIGDPLMHLVRNAMDHGIESPEERVAAGKPSHARLGLNAYHDSGSIVIEVSDDGYGLDHRRILAKARERGLVGPNQQLSHAEIERLIFEPGFSTASQVTNLSGRGVGMDVVKRNIEALRGTVEVDTTPGRGTVFTIRLPLTLAIIDGFLVGVGHSSYVIPLDMVQECIEVTEEVRGETMSDARYINLRGEVLPFLRLNELFDEQRRDLTRENIVVVQYAGAKAGLVVEELLGEFQTVIKPLGPIFAQLRGVSGATILGTGEVAVILDVPQLVQAAAGQAGVSHNATVH